MVTSLYYVYILNLDQWHSQGTLVSSTLLQNRGQPASGRAL